MSKTTLSQKNGIGAGTPMPALGQTNEGLGLTDPQPAGGVLVKEEGKQVRGSKGPGALKRCEASTLSHKTRRIDRQNHGGSWDRDAIKSFCKNLHVLQSPILQLNRRVFRTLQSWGQIEHRGSRSSGGGTRGT